VVDSDGVCEGDSDELGVRDALDVADMDGEPESVELTEGV
jgi:hypothetical protein